MRERGRKDRDAQRESKRRGGEERDGQQDLPFEFFHPWLQGGYYGALMQGGRRQGGGAQGGWVGKREKKNERERKGREAQRESNGFTLELFELNI